MAKQSKPTARDRAYVFSSAATPGMERLARGQHVTVTVFEGRTGSPERRTGVVIETGRRGRYAVNDGPTEYHHTAQALVEFDDERLKLESDGPRMPVIICAKKYL